MLMRLLMSVLGSRPSHRGEKPVRGSVTPQRRTRRLSLESLEAREVPAHFVIQNPGSMFAQVSDMGLTHSNVWHASAPYTAQLNRLQRSAPDVVEAGFSGNGGELTTFVHLGIPKAGTTPVASVVSRPSLTPGGAGTLTYELVADKGDRVGHPVVVDLRPVITGNTAGAKSSVHVSFVVFSGGREVYRYDQTVSGAAKHLGAAPACKFTSAIGASFQICISVSAVGGGDRGDLRAQVAIGPIYSAR